MSKSCPTFVRNSLRLCCEVSKLLFLSLKYIVKRNVPSAGVLRFRTKSPNASRDLVIDRGRCDINQFVEIVSCDVAGMIDAIRKTDARGNARNTERTSFRLLCAPLCARATLPVPSVIYGEDDARVLGVLLFVVVFELRCNFTIEHFSPYMPGSAPVPTQRRYAPPLLLSLSVSLHFSSLSVLAPLRDCSPGRRRCES